MDESENPYAAPEMPAAKPPRRPASRIPWWLLEIAVVIGIVVALFLLLNSVYGWVG